MFQGLQEIILEDGALFGLRPDFLLNLIAEGMGTVIGIVISVSVALWLDMQREKNRHRDHRGRAVTRWVKIHATMIEEITLEYSHNAGPEHIARAVAAVQEAERNAADIRADYAAALERGVIAEAYEDYARGLDIVEQSLLTNGFEIEPTESAVSGATSALARLVRAAGARRIILNIEPIFARGGAFKLKVSHRASQPR